MPQKGGQPVNARRLISRDIDLEHFDPGPVPDDAILVRNDFTAGSNRLSAISNWQVASSVKCPVSGVGSEHLSTRHDQRSDP